MQTSKTTVDRIGTKLRKPEAKSCPDDGSLQTQICDSQGSKPQATPPDVRRKHSAANESMGNPSQRAHDDPSTAERPPIVILRIKTLTARTGESRSTTYEKMNPDSPRFDKDFPRPIKLSGSSSSTAIGWIESEVNTYLESRVAASRRNDHAVNRTVISNVKESQ